MPKPLQLLILEDDPLDAELEITALQEAGYKCRWERVETRDEFLARLDSADYDLILADYNLPTFDGLTALKLFLERDLNRPFILVSGELGEENAIESLKAGATDYVLKDRLSRLAPVVQRALREMEEQRERRLAEKALAESEENLRSVVETAIDAIIVIDDQGYIVSWNPGAEKMFGYPAVEAKGKSLSLIMPERFRENHHEGGLSVAFEEMSRVIGKTVELGGRKKNGLEFPIELSLASWQSGAGRFFTGIIRDITERVQAEERIQRQLRRLDGLRKIDQAIIGTLDLKIPLNILLEQVTQQLNVEAADILIHNPHTHTLEFMVGIGFRTTALQYTNLRLGESYAGRTALERRIVHIPNMSHIDNGFAKSPQLKDEDFISYYGVPLIAKGEVKGVLEVFHRVEFHPDIEWLSYLETLAGQAAIAIDNANLFNDLQRSNLEITRAYDSTLEGWAKALELRDQETEGHSRRVVTLTLKLARALDIREDELIHVRRGALLHDIGKMGIPDRILQKPGPLDEVEWEIMRHHPLYAYEWLSSIQYLQPALDIPYCHHEKWNGSGYPRGLKGEEIPLTARIFAVVDVWDALLSKRPYRDAWPEEKVRSYIQEQAGSHFDPEVVTAFLK
ncbi:MAG: PAS domain S-box protein [Anaerolineaceae bacterium]|nr:PAS domain S-box protein [Anaerolineaceae bacterium]